MIPSLTGCMTTWRLPATVLAIAAIAATAFLSYRRPLAPLSPRERATLTGLLGLSFAGSYAMILVSVAMIGLGSAVFHPEATRMARHAAAGQQGFAQGIFQIGGHVGYAAGPLLAAMLVVPRGQTSIAWMSVVALVAMALMAWTGARYSEMRSVQVAATKGRAKATAAPIPPGWPILMAMTVLVVLLLSKGTFTAAFTTYYTFYLIERFGVTVQLSQVMLFLYLVVGAIGVIIGGMVAVTSPPVSCTSPVPTRFRMPSASFMMREIRMPVCVESK